MSRSVPLMARLRCRTADAAHELYWALADRWWHLGMFIGRMRERFAVRPVSVEPPAPIVSPVDSFNLIANRARITAYVQFANEHRVPLGEYLKQAEPLVRLTAEHGELADFACLAGLLFHKAIHHHGEGNNPHAALEAMIEALTLLARLVHFGFEGAADLYARARAMAADNVVRHVDTILEEEGISPLPVHEPEVAAALSAALPQSRSMH